MTPERDVELVPAAALRWLFGEEGEFECPPDRYFRGKPPAFWWRSVFREKIAALSQGRATTAEGERIKDLEAWNAEIRVGVEFLKQQIATLQAERDAAVAQERERCAKIAESLIDPMSGSQYEYGRDFAAQNIASMIRNRRDG